MGVTITATNAKYDFDMGYGGFFNLRKNIALALDDDFGQIYLRFAKCITDEDYKENDRLAKSVINQKHLDKQYADVLDFLYASDEGGKIGYRTCKKISDMLERCLPALRTKTFRYANYAGHDYEDFIEFLKDCVKYHKNMRWH